MFLGLLFALGACFVWGWIFIIPEFLHDFTGIEVVLGRYLMYGTLSAVLLFRKGFTNLGRYSSRAWSMAFIFALLSNILYYFGIVAGLRFASPPITVLIIGMAPIVIAVYGNWSVREISYRSLVIPFVCIVVGMAFVNATEVDWSFSSYTLQQYLVGLLGILTALLAWSWYAVNNARFLKRNPHIPSSEWATVIGVGTLAWTVVLGVLFSLVLNQEFQVSKFFSWNPSTAQYFMGTFVLGVLCSWLGCFLWNRASSYLPVSLMGPILIFETLFGLLFVFIFQKRFPSVLEFLGVAIMLSGILLSVYIFRKNQFKATQAQTVRRSEAEFLNDREC